MNANTDNVVLRKYPFPYRSALAICNDTDGMSWSAFREWHDYVNSKSDTIYGTGLGLEVGDSFWYWSDRERFALYHNSPDQLAERSPEYDYIVEMARLGWLDTLHGFGSWIAAYRLDRDTMISALAEMGELGIFPKVYVNHGGGKHMVHNLGGPWGYYQEGDNPKSPAYCLDLLLQHGFRYFWTDTMFESEKFGDCSTWSSQKIRDAAEKSYNAKRFFNARTGDRQANLDITSRALGVESEDDIRRMMFDNLFIPVTMRDGNRVLGVKRYRGEFSPDAGSFAYQVSAARLDDLVTREAVVVIYQHFGIWRALSSPPKDYSSWRNSCTPVFDAHCQWAFRYLADRQARGEIFITTTQRLLNYLRARDHLSFDVSETRDSIHITLKSIDCPIYGPEPATAAGVQGITFVADGSPESITVSDARGKEIPFERYSDQGQTVVAVPWHRLEYPH